MNNKKGFYQKLYILTLIYYYPLTVFSYAREVSDMTEESLTAEQIDEKMHDMKVVIDRLSWDEKRNQINPAKKEQLNVMRKEYEELKAKIEAMQK